MYLSTARIGPLKGLADISPDRLIEVLWRNPASGARIEHLRVRAGPQSLDIAIFTSAGTQAESDEVARRLIVATLNAQPELNLWRLL
ncbi:hypothetical protein AB0M47_41045 [Hamadaea sp. NPDC051192]|uniref:hypothetical protein n=1 Tax=Hamadaea sp. NPDC051192 TaxID=3154940 RepID=UPI00341B5FE1